MKRHQSAQTAISVASYQSIIVCEGSGSKVSDHIGLDNGYSNNTGSNSNIADNKVNVSNGSIQQKLFSDNVGDDYGSDGDYGDNRDNRDNRDNSSNYDIENDQAHSDGRKSRHGGSMAAEDSFDNLESSEEVIFRRLQGDRKGDVPETADASVSASSGKPPVHPKYGPQGGDRLSNAAGRSGGDEWTPNRHQYSYKSFVSPQKGSNDVKNSPGPLNLSSPNLSPITLLKYDGYSNYNNNYYNNPNGNYYGGGNIDGNTRGSANAPSSPSLSHHFVRQLASQYSGGERDREAGGGLRARSYSGESDLSSGTVSGRVGGAGQDVSYNLEQMSLISDDGNSSVDVMSFLQEDSVAGAQQAQLGRYPKLALKSSQNYNSNSNGNLNINGNINRNGNNTIPIINRNTNSMDSYSNQNTGYRQSMHPQMERMSPAYTNDYDGHSNDHMHYQNRNEQVYSSTKYNSNNTMTNTNYVDDMHSNGGIINGNDSGLARKLRSDGQQYTYYNSQPHRAGPAGPHDSSSTHSETQTQTQSSPQLRSTSNASSSASPASLTPAFASAQLRPGTMFTLILDGSGSPVLVPVILNSSDKASLGTTEAQSATGSNLEARNSPQGGSNGSSHLNDKLDRAAESRNEISGSGNNNSNNNVNNGMNNVNNSSSSSSSSSSNSSSGQINVHTQPISVVNNAEGVRSADDENKTSNNSTNYSTNNNNNNNIDNYNNNNNNNASIKASNQTNSTPSQAYYSPIASKSRLPGYAGVAHSPIAFDDTDSPRVIHSMIGIGLDSPITPNLLYNGHKDKIHSASPYHNIQSTQNSQKDRISEIEANSNSSYRTDGSSKLPNSHDNKQYQQQQRQAINQMRDPRVSPLNPYANFNFDPSTSTQTNSTANHLLGDPVQDRIYSKMNSQHLPDASTSRSPSSSPSIQQSVQFERARSARSTGTSSSPLYSPPSQGSSFTSPPLASSASQMNSKFWKNRLNKRSMTSILGSPKLAFI